MANTQMGSINLNFTNSLKSNVNANDLSPTNYHSLFNLRARLNGVNAAYYTTAKLDQMTVNDMIFALRNIDDPTTIASYMTSSAA